MTITAIVSGQAGLGLVTRPALRLRSGDGSSSEVPASDAADRLFQGCTDAHWVTVNTLDDLDHVVRQAKRVDRALQLLLLFLDPSEPEDFRRECAACIEELLQEDVDVEKEVAARMTAAPFPGTPDARIAELWNEAPSVKAFLECIFMRQPTIAKVSRAFDHIDYSKFETPADQQELRELLIRSGAFRDLVQAIATGEDLRFRRLEYAHTFRAHQDAIKAWFDELSPTTRIERPPQLEEYESDTDWDADDDTPIASRTAFEQVKAQIHTIARVLNERDVTEARRLANALISQQRFDSTADQIAKSLCNLAMKAKVHEVPELQLEWAEWATRENPMDPKTHGHYADALIGVGRFDEATRALEDVENVGDLRYAETARARILNATGRLDEARALFLSTAEKYPEHPETIQALIGAAETLRDMGAFGAAQVEIEQLTKQFPMEPRVWECLASVQIDQGALDEALKTFGKASANAPRYIEQRARYQNGRAFALRLSGRFEESLSLYDEVLTYLPNNSFALNGRASVFRDAGKFDAALAAYDVAMERSPYNPHAYSGKAKLLRELSRFEEAGRLYEFAREKFPYNQALVYGEITFLRTRGHYALALEKADAACEAYAYNASLRVARGKVLAAMRHTEEALAAFDLALSMRSTYGQAIVAKASLLLQNRRFDEAKLLLPSSKPRSQIDWSRYFLNAMLVYQTSGLGEAAKLLGWGMKSSPFARYQTLMRTALAKLELDRNRLREARRIVEDAPTQVSNIVALHTYAAAHRPGAARSMYKTILEARQSAEVIELATEIARRNGLIEGKAQHSDSWVSQRELEMILDAA